MHHTGKISYMFVLPKKESTEVWITQNMGKERENSYQRLKRYPEERHTSLTYPTHTHVMSLSTSSPLSTLTRYILYFTSPAHITYPIHTHIYLLTSIHSNALYPVLY